MDVASESKAKQSSSVLGAAQVLLHSSTESADVVSITKRVSMASLLLTQSPGLSSVALNVLASAYQCYFLQPDQESGEDRGLATALHQAEEVISSLLDHAPHTWSHRVLQWCVDVASGATRSQAVSSYSLEELLRQWLHDPKLVTVLKILDTCTLNMVASGRGGECVQMAVKQCLDHAPKLNWLLTHLLSLQPESLVSPFLELVLLLPLSPPSSSFTAVGEIMEFLSHSCRVVVGKSVLSVVEKVVRGGLGEGWSKQVELLLRLAPRCESLLSFISEDCLLLVTADKIKAIVIAASNGGDELRDNLMSNDEDDGEVRSEDETARQTNGEMANHSSGSVETAVLEVLAVLGKEAAARAISQLIETYSCLVDLAERQEEAMEEGEIVHVSLVNVVQESCQAILSQLLHRLHVATMSHLAVGPQTARETGGEDFTVGLECGLQQWCRMMLQPNMDTKCRGWLSSAISSVCVYAAEIQAAQALASLLIHCHHNEHLEYVLRVYREVSVRYTLLAEAAVEAALASCREGEDPRWLCENLWRITVAMEASMEPQTRSKFTSAVSVNLSQLSTLLCDLSESWETGEDWENGRRCEVWKLLEVVGVVGGLDKSKGDYCTHCRVLANVLFSIFNYVTKSSISLQQVGRVDLMAEMCLGRCATLLAEWVGSDSNHGNRDALKMFFITSLFKSALSVDGGELGGMSRARVRGTAGEQLPALTSIPSGLACRYPQMETTVWHTAHSTDHILSLLQLVANGDGAMVVSVMLDMVTPHLPSDSTPWLPGEGPRSTSLEWSLSVKRQFDKHPLLWHLLLFSAHSGCGFAQCEPLICSLLLVLTQHWFSCRCSRRVVPSRERHSSEWLVEALAVADWLPVPLRYCAELFQLVTSHDLYMLMSAISGFIKDNLQDLRRGAVDQLKGSAYKEVLKGVLVRNIHKLGNVYGHYVV